MIADIISAALWFAGCTGPAGAVLLWLIPRLRRLEIRQAQHAEIIARLQSALELAGGEMCKQGVQTRQELIQLREGQQRMELVAPGPRPYSHAIRLVRSGAGVEDLIAVCGLSRAEANLIASIHADKDRIAAAVL